MTDSANIITAIKYEVTYGLSIGILDLSLDISKGHGHDYAHIDGEYL